MDSKENNFNKADHYMIDANEEEMSENLNALEDSRELSCHCTLELSCAEDELTLCPEDEQLVELTEENVKIAKNGDLNEFVDHIVESVIDNKEVVEENAKLQQIAHPMREYIVKNVRQYVQGLENTPEMTEFKQRLKNEMYTNILEHVWNDGEEDIDITEIPNNESKLVALCQTVKEEHLKSNFETLVKMFEDFAQNLHSKQTKKRRTDESFSYLDNRKSSKGNLLDEKNKAEDFIEYPTCSYINQNKNENGNLCYNNKNNNNNDININERKSVAQQTDKISHASFGCQVSLISTRLLQTKNVYTTSTIRSDYYEIPMRSTFLNEINYVRETSRELSSPIRELNTEGSGLTLTKISNSCTDLFDDCQTSVPCEQEFHTIQIDAVSSPPSSVLRRPPLCTRFWHVVTDFCIAACFCIQVNKDCIFCMAFFVTFVVSTSFLTAFFYRALTADSGVFPQHTLTTVDLNKIQTHYERPHRI